MLVFMTAPYACKRGRKPELGKMPKRLVSLPVSRSIRGTPPLQMLIDPLVIGEVETVPDGPVAFSRRPVAYATGSPTIRSKSVVLSRPAPTAGRSFDAPRQMRVCLKENVMRKGEQDARG